MSTLHNVLGVARYERIMLMRTTRFRALGFIGILIPVFMGVVLSIAETQGGVGESASTFGLSAFIPFYFYTYLQTVVIAFVAGNFRAADERAEVQDVIGARPLSTTELVLGKYLGVVEALTILSLSVVGLTLAIQAAKISIAGTPFVLAPYAIYFFLMTLPALIFMSALTFFLGAALRNPTAVALSSIAYVIAVLFFLGTRYGGIFDFGAFFAPLYYSDMLGLGDLSRLIQIRVFYLSLSIALVGMAVMRYPRLTQRGVWSRMGPLFAAAGIVGAVGLYAQMASEDAAIIENRTSLFATQISHADAAVPAVLDYQIDVALMKDGVPLSARTDLLLLNDNDVALDTLLFTLNPGLIVQSVRAETGAELAFEVEGSVVRVTPTRPLLPGVETTISMSYAGDVDRAGFDLLRSAARIEKRDGPIRRGDLTSWIRSRSAFLPPRSRWYPVPGVDYGNSGPRPLSFSSATITVDAPAGLEVITQGAPSPIGGGGDPGRSRTSWDVQRPVPQFSLNMGEYEVFEAEIAGTDVALYVHPSHVPQVMLFEDATEEVVGLVEQLLTTMARETGLPYPYSRLSVVEVPFFVQWYYEGWEENGGLTQPGVLMLEENELLERSNQMKRRITRSLSSERGQSLDPGRLKRDQLAGTIFSVFLSPEGNSAGLFRSPLVQLWSFNRGFEGDNASLLARGMPVYLQEDIAGEIRSSLFQRGRGSFGGRSGFSGRGGGGFGGGRPQDRGSGGGVTISVSIGEDDRRRGPRQLGDDASWDEMLEAMQHQSLAELDPEADPDLYRSVLDAKGLTMFRMIEAVVGSDEFVDTLEAFGEASEYEDVSFEQFERAVVPEGVDEAEVESSNLEGLIRDWVYGTYVPGYTLTRTEAKKVDDGWGAVVYQVMVRVRNGEPGQGFVQVSVSGRGDEISKNVVIEGGQEVEVSMTIGVRPFVVTVEPFLAKNRRPLRSPLRIPEEVEAGPPETYVRVVTEDEAAYTEIIVDNEDEGFSMPVRRVQKYLRPGLEGGNWGVESHRYAFGRYETNYRWKSPGDGAQPAAWTATLPHAGEYDVAYYYLPERINGRTIRRGAADTFKITLSHAGEETVMRINADQLEAGWNLLGRFRFEEGEEARIELSDESDGRVYADAVRWRYVDPDNPNAFFDEGLLPWQFGGRSGFGGPGGFGRGGGPGGGDHGVGDRSRRGGRDDG